jgi:hypothetical protein
VSFDFYDDWDEDENEGLLGWGDDDADTPGYGTVDVQQQQPGRQRGMSYPRDRRRKSHEGITGADALGGPSFFGRLFGGSRAVRYKPSSADLQDHPGAKRSGKDRGEAEALLEESEGSVGRVARRHGRKRSGTAGSRETLDSLSSRGDIFPSDDEDDAIPLDDEFAMVLERRNTQSGPETETSSGNIGSIAPKKRGKRPSAGSRVSSRRTFSTRSESGRENRSRNASVVHTPVDESLLNSIEDIGAKEIEVPTMVELSQEERDLAREEEAEVERKRIEAQQAASVRGLAEVQQESKDADAPSSSAPDVETGEPSQEASSTSSPQEGAPP